MKYKKTLSAVIATAGVVAAVALHSNSYPPGTLPDYPGAINHTLTDPSTTICNKDWSTSSIRPPTSYTNPLKAKRLAEFNVKYGTTYQMADGELDHIISIELLGDPTDPNNLDFEPYNIPLGAHQKDKIENLLHSQVCSGAITLQAAQKAISGDWTKVKVGQFGSVDSAVDADDTGI